MEQWEYVAVAIAWERRAREYVARGIDDERRVGLTDILNDYGAEGWELVTLMAEDLHHAHHPPSRSGGWHWRAVFKRRLPGAVRCRP